MKCLIWCTIYNIKRSDNENTLLTKIEQQGPNLFTLLSEMTKMKQKKTTKIEKYEKQEISRYWKQVTYYNSP